MEMSKVKIDTKKILLAFKDNEVVEYNLASIIADFEFMHKGITFTDDITEEEAQATKHMQLCTFICGVISASSPSSTFQRDLKLPKTHSHAKKKDSDDFAKSLGL